MAYATVDEVEAGFRALSEEERSTASSLLEEAAVIIDAYGAEAAEDAKRVVSCRMVRRAIGDGESAAPIGATQVSVAALDYSQNWTIANGASGELYLAKIDKKLLGVGSRIGARSSLEGMVSGRD